MKQETSTVVRSILTADETVPKDKIETVLRNFRRMTDQHRHLIGARQAMEILGVSRPTLRAYAKQGLITQIAFSSRKIRFDEDNVRSFADNGAPSAPNRLRASSPEPQDTRQSVQELEIGF